MSDEAGPGWCRLAYKKVVLVNLDEPLPTLGFVV